MHATHTMSFVHPTHIFYFIAVELKKFNGKYWQSYFFVTSNNFGNNIVCERSATVAWSMRLNVCLCVRHVLAFYSLVCTHLCCVCVLINNRVIINHKSDIVFLFILALRRLISLRCVCELSKCIFIFISCHLRLRFIYLKSIVCRLFFFLFEICVLNVSVIWATHCINTKSVLPGEKRQENEFFIVMPFYAEYELCAWFRFFCLCGSARGLCLCRIEYTVLLSSVIICQANKDDNICVCILLPLLLLLSSLFTANNNDASTRTSQTIHALHHKT